MYTKAERLFDPKSKTSFKLSRSKVDLFVQCPRCFYMDCRFGVGRPGFPPYTLNSAVDSLLKNEFDLLRKKGESHELMKQYHIDAIPCNHADIAKWRGETPETRYIGISTYYDKTNFILTGMVDDVWEDKDGNLLIVDYKATSTEKEISLEDKWKQGYKRQIEFYQWLFRQNGFKVSDSAYFVFANAGKNRPKFDGKLEFEMSIVSHTGNDKWVEPLLADIRKALESNKIPEPDPECEYCDYRRRSVEAVVKHNK